MIQAVIFDKHLYTKRQCHTWLRHHGLNRIKNINIHETLNYFRCRIREPNESLYHYRTRNIHNGIKIVMQFPKY